MTEDSKSASSTCLDLLILNASQVVTMREHSDRPMVAKTGFDLGVILGGYVAVSNGIIAAVGHMNEIRIEDGNIYVHPVKSLNGLHFKTNTSTELIDARGKIVLPGFVDSHTHLVFAGWREKEMVKRLGGATYTEILASGGGIHETVRATRQSTEDELFEISLERLSEVLSNGTTTIEIKSGYGLSVAEEIKILKVIKRLGQTGMIDVVPTCLAAHAIPVEYAKDPWAYVNLVVNKLLPIVADERLAEFVDVFCDIGAFTVEQARQILKKGSELGFKLKIHADELAGSGGAELAAEIGAVTAEHLLRISNTGIKALSQKGVVATLLPGTPYFLQDDCYAPARLMLEENVPIALASDFNPGTCPMGNISLIMNLATIMMGMSPEQSIAGVTINGAHALGRAREIGSLEPGKFADCLLCSCEDYHHLIYRFGVNLIDTVIKKGRIVIQRRPQCAISMGGMQNH